MKALLLFSISGILLMLATLYGQAWTLILLFDVVPKKLQATAFAQYSLITVAALIPTLVVLVLIGWFTKQLSPARLGIGVTVLSLVTFGLFRLVTELPLVEVAPLRQVIECVLQLVLAPVFVWFGRKARQLLDR